MGEEFKRKTISLDVREVADCALDGVAVVACGSFRGFSTWPSERS